MKFLQFIFAFKIIGFFSFALGLIVLWMLGRGFVYFVSAGEAAAFLLIDFSFRPVHFIVRLTNRIYTLFAAVFLQTVEIISVFLNLFYRIVLSSIAKVYSRAQSRYIPVFFVGLAFFLTVAAVSLFVQMPQPNTHDEFGYLLQADTFAHGRLTNPPPPLPRHFESFHIILSPTYTAKYPPAQGLFLALGQVLTGLPIAGVWLSFALMMAAIYWGLKPFFSPGWSLVTTVLAGVRMGLVGEPYLADGFGYWSQSYWGGAVAALGGALLFGACRRLWEKPSVFHSLLAGLGLALMANSRPYEGLIACVPAALVFLVWLYKDRTTSLRLKVQRVCLPLFATMLLTVSWMGYYNWRVTGHPLKTPYSVHEETYGMPPIFVGQKVQPKVDFKVKPQKDYYAGYVQRLYAYHSTLKGFLDLTVFRVQQMWVFFLGFFLVIPLLFLKKEDFAGSVWSWFYGLAIVAMALGEMPVERLPFPHYVAPVTLPLYYFVTLGLIRLSQWRWKDEDTGKYLVRFILVLSLCEALIPLKYKNNTPFCAWHSDRARVLEQLTRMEGRQLVIVRYAADHSFHNEWVYNNADLERSKVVWARELSPEENDELCRHFAGRHIWLLKADEQPPRLREYGREVAGT